MRTLLLIRHAKAMDREQWSGPDVDRPLTVAGVKQAMRLANHWAGAGIGRVLSSPAVRCVETVRPLADALGLAIETDPSLLEGQVIALPEWIGVLAVCAHGDNIPMLLQGLGLPGEPCRKGSVWEVRWRGATPVRAAYHDT